MEITLKLHGYLPWYTKERAHEYKIKIKKKSSLKNILKSFHIPISDIILISVNQEQTNWKIKLKDGDLVELFPPIAGG